MKETHTNNTESTMRKLNEVKDEIKRLESLLPTLDTEYKLAMKRGDNHAADRYRSKTRDNKREIEVLTWVIAD